MERLSLELKPHNGGLESRSLRKINGHGKCFTSFNCSLSSRWEGSNIFSLINFFLFPKNIVLFYFVLTQFMFSIDFFYSVKASYKIATSSSGNADSSNPLRVEHSKINGSNGVISNWNLTRNNYNGILDSFKDEYGGIIINADRLPRDPKAFADALPVSLSYWKLIVSSN